MSPLDTEFHRRLAKRLDAEYKSAMEALASGMLDHLEYKRVCGRIRAIADVKEWCAEVESDMNQGK